jgi:tetratricopeptide (TPR) repeat protein
VPPLRATRASHRTPGRLTPPERLAWRLGVRSFERGEVDAAIEHLTRLVATRPRFADVHYMLGLLYEQRGDLDESARRLEQALSLNPDYVEARVALAAVSEQRGDFARSEALVAAAPERAGADGADPLTRAKLANLQAALADAFREAGELGEAIAAYRKALDRCPQFHDIRHRLAVALREHGLPGEAVRELERVVRGNPDYLDARVQLGLAWLALGQWGRAVEQWRAALDRDPERSDVQMYLKLHEPRTGASLPQGKPAPLRGGPVP